jgi:hypothetical protein
MPTTQTFICRESPVGVINGINTIFTLSNIPSPNTEQVFLNGVLMNSGNGNDYTINGNVITFLRQIQSDDIILVNYFIEVEVVTNPDEDVDPLSTSSRKELIHWCLRKLGAPVIDINVDEDQIEDRIDEALMYFRDYHFDGVERCYLHYKITASTMKLETQLVQDLVKGSLLTGSTSGATAVVVDKSIDNKTIRFISQNKKLFKPGETVLVGDGSVSFEILNNSSAVILGDVDNKFIPVGKRIISITNIIPQQSSTIGGNLGGMFDFQYQFALNNMFNLASTDLITYDIYQRYISQWEFMFRGSKGIRFNRKTDRVYLDVQNWAVDSWIVLEAWSALDPKTYSEIYTDEFVREYAYNLIKQQWGTNLKKYSGIQMPGGVTLNGQELYDEATTELEKLKEKVRKEFELPPDFLVG